MNLIRTSILTFISTIITMLSALVVNKAIAIYIGPSGLALIGQFRNFSQLVMTVAKGGINNGVTKYTAEYGKENKRIPILFSTAGKISLYSSLVVGLAIILFSKHASLYFLQTQVYTYIFIIFGFTIVLFVINSLLLTIINGLREIKTWVIINIVQSIYSLIFTSLLIFFLGLDGALIALVTNQSIILLVILWMLRKHPIIQYKSFKQKFNTLEAKKLAKFSAMAITSALTIPISHLIIRNYIGETLSWEDAGYWQAMWYISGMYLMVVTTTLSIYYLPKLSSVTDKLKLRKEMIQGYQIVIPIVVLASISVYLLRDFIIWLLFTKDFTPMRELFLWQLIGDVFKIAALLIANLLHAKAMMKTYISTEIIFSISFVLLSIWFVSKFGLVGMSYSFAANYAIYFISMIVLTKSQWSGN